VKSSSYPQAAKAVETRVITLTLLHPIQSTPVQSWTFERDDVIRIGRSTDNQVVLYSAVVSRHHVELRQSSDSWEVVSLGANGTYIDGKRVIRVPVQDGLTFRLARSGPNLQVHLGAPPAGRIPTKPSDVGTVGRPSFLPESDDDIPNTLGLPNIADIDSKLLESATNIAPSENPGASSNEPLFSPTTGRPMRVLQTIGEYQVVKILGKGETAITCMAWKNGHVVAIKTLNPQWAKDKLAIQQFTQLAHSLAPLNHPSLPRVLEVLTLEERVYLVTEMVYGQSLSQYVNNYGPVPRSEVIAWGIEICEVLAHLHERGLVHANLTPAHLIRRSVLRSGHGIVLTDFGLIRMLNWQTATGFDTASYAAPEQRNGVATAQTDQYGLGTTLTFLLTGQEPGDFYGQGGDGYRFYPKVGGEMDSKMGALLQRLTHPDPQARFGDLQEVMTALRQVI
jgi:pSer/pThr/pTyr-binding forkhead associated (FHA) protein